ncbi:MAG: alpha-maltose-phosphate synthase [Frankiales bacterium]|nr:alpha-maltose-phosphate synthase [Frankiales bacterium]
MRVAMLTREWPPEIYGGAGVHVEQLVAALRPDLDVDVHCFGPPRSDATAHGPWDALAGANAALEVLSADLSMAAVVGAADVVHSHTWYTNLAGHLAKELYAVPHVMTAHSLEPLRPWKAEQLGGGYAVSSWVEHTALHAADAVIAVSAGMRRDVLATYPGVDPDRVHVIHNGIDADAWRPDRHTDALARHGVDPDRPYVAFVGRITRQKGVPDLLAAAKEFDPGAGIVLCAGAADTPELRTEVADAVAALQATRSEIIWIEEMLPRNELRQLLTNASVFVCPSVYEPLGIVNLEAMACETAVVATNVGGIPEVVDDGVTGLLIPPSDPAALAHAVNQLLTDPTRATAMGIAGRRRIEEQFTWTAVAEQTIALYDGLRA